MATFTQDEVESVVEKLLRSTIRRPYDTLGIRRTDVTFNDIQEAAAGVFILHSKAPFYLAFLAKERLSEAVSGVSASLSALLDALRVLRKRVIPVRDISALVNAKVAMQELETVVSSAKPPADISRVPSYVRFNQNVDRFVAKVGGNIKDSTGIVATPNEARFKIPGLVQQVQEQVKEILRKVDLLAVALVDYGKLGLVQLAAKGVVSRARAVLDSRASSLAGMNDNERLVVLRETILELLGTKAVVKKFGQFTGPASAFNLSGTLLPFSDKERPANEARLASDKSGPFVLVPGLDATTSTNVLRIWLDGAPSHPAAPTVQFFLPPSQQPKLEGLQQGPFNIVAGTNNVLRVLVNGTTTVDVTLTPGSARTAAQVAADLTIALSPSGFKGEAYFSPLMFDGEVISSGNTLTLAYGVFPASSVSVGDEVDFYYGPNATQTRTVTAILTSGASTTGIVVDGALLVSSSVNRVQYGAASRRIRIVAVNRTAAIENRYTVQLKMPDDLRRDTGITLGMFGELYSKGEPTDAQVVADFVTQNSTKVRAELDFRPVWPSIQLRTEVTDAFTIVAYYFRGEGAWSGAGPVIVTVADELPATVVVGHSLVLRGGQNPDKVGVITAISGQVLTVTFSSPVTASSGIVEIGPNNAITFGMSVVVELGVNAGRYIIDAPHASIPFQFKLKSVMPQYRDGFNQFVPMLGSVGSDGVAFFSRTPGLMGSIEVYDPLLVFMSNAGPHVMGANTPYAKLPSNPTDLSEGDLLELYASNLEVPTYLRVIEQLYSDGVVKLNDSISATFSWALGSSVLPFAVLRTNKVLAFEAFSTQLKTWRLNSDLEDTYFTDLARFIQPLLSNANPTDAQVGAAEQRVRDLYKLFVESVAVQQNAANSSLEWFLSGYSSPVVSEVDALVKAFKEKGADRAVDLLLECQFSTFFGLDVDETSYAGSFQKALREVARLDMPVRKTNRNIARAPKVIAQMETPDYEFDDSDLDPTPPLDPPIEV